MLVGGQAVNFWASFYQGRVPALAREAPFTSKDIDFCGDERAVRDCAERLGGTPRVATFDDATPNTGTVVFIDGAGSHTEHWTSSPRLFRSSTASRSMTPQFPSSSLTQAPVLPGASAST